MAKICNLSKFEVNRNEKFLEIAEELTPKLHSTLVKSTGLPKKPLKKGDRFVLDFGDHQVGYVMLNLSSVGSHQDAPAYIYLRFAERLEELETETSEYEGWLSKGWIQEEYIHVDVLPAKLELPRRYAFRYMEIKVIDVSIKYSLVIDDVSVRAVSAVAQEIPQLQTRDPLLGKIDQVSIRTLHNCMQRVFEDGPKRDQRLWLGDLRLQARANYKTFQYNDLVKRCLYLFGGLTFNEGKVPACVFTEPIPEPDDTYLFDYALLYGSVLLDYYEETDDYETLKDLYPIAIRQIEIGLSYLNEDNVIEDHSGEPWCFIDWGDKLNIQAASLAVLIYSMRYGVRLARKMGDDKTINWLEEKLEVLKKSAVENFWDEKEGMFVSGAERQISWATQIWMILAKVFPKEKNRELIRRTIDKDPEIQMVSPYMYHHYIDALIRSGEEAYALEEIKRYWGEMVRDGADTFWEVYNPSNKKESPYGTFMSNSFCHAWSCTPTYFLRKFYLDIL